MAPMWSECIPCGRVSHDILYRSMLSTWSVCLSIYCPRGQCVSHIIPRGQCVSRYDVSIHTVHMVGNGSAYIAHVPECLVVSIDAVHIIIMYHHILPMWSKCLAICRINSDCPHYQHAHIINMSTYCPCGQCVSPHVVHVVRVYRDMLYQSMLSTSSACLTTYCPCGHLPTIRIARYPCVMLVHGGTAVMVSGMGMPRYLSLLALYWSTHDVPPCCVGSRGTARIA
jgi:hypothetical protein